MIWSPEEKIKLLESEVARLEQWNAALTKAIENVCGHEGLCRIQNRQLWQQNEDLSKENGELKSRLTNAF